MEVKLRELYQDRASEQDTLGILIIEKDKGHQAITDRNDVILLVIKEENSEPWFVKHYEFMDKKVAMHHVDEQLLHNWIITGNNRRFIDWLFNGKIIFDRNEYLAGIKHRLHDFPLEERRKKMTIELSKLVRRFEDGKALYQTNNYLDAFNHILHALHHKARLAVIESGFYPEVTVWNQIKNIDPEIYKLYTELITGEESLEKRMELLMLASEFAISQKLEVGSGHLIEVMNRRHEPWTIADLMAVTEIEDYKIDIELLIDYLVQKGIITVVAVETKGAGIYHRYYTVKN